MTISTTVIKNSYSGNGSNDTFAYTFKISADADMQVIIRSATGSETVKNLTTHYTVTGAGTASGGNVVFTAGNIPTATETVVLRRNSTQTQVLDLVENDPFTAESIETAFDKNLSIAQELQEQIDRSIKVSRTSTIASSEITSSATERANKILSFDGSGNLSAEQELGSYRGNWAASTAYKLRDLVKDTSTNNVFLCETAHTSSGSQPLTTNTDSAKWELIVDAASSTTSQTAAASSATAAANSATASANSATAAATSESNASTSASTATTQASTATTQAGIATTKASEASTSATNAATSETNAAASATSAAASAGGGAVKVTSSDTTPSTLNVKVLVAGGMTKAVNNAGGNETLTLTAQAAEIYGFELVDTDSDGITETIRVTTTNNGADSISSTVYAAFDDVIYGASGMSWSLTADGDLRVTI